MKVILTILILFVSICLTAQNPTINSRDSDPLKEFQIFFEKFGNENSDAFITSKDSSVRYQVVFSIPSRFADPKVHFSRTFSIQNIKRDTMQCEIEYFPSKADSNINGFRSNKCGGIKTILLTKMWGEPLKDSFVNVESHPSFWASCISFKTFRFLPLIDNHRQEHFVLGKHQDIMRGFYGKNIPSVISYKNGKYLVVDVITHFSYIGNQTDYGTCVTYYLERIDENE